MAKIKVDNVYKAFGAHKVLQGINLEVQQGESLVILGGSGTGKSVLLKAIVGLIPPDYGSIYIDGQDTTHLPRSQRTKFFSKCGFLFQAGALFDSLTVEENIVFFAQKLYSLSKKELSRLAQDKLSKVGLDARILNLFPCELSGGMQKRVALARTICTNPEIIFFDEPTTGLDPIMSNVINELIATMHKEMNITCITITHDMNSARKIGTQIAMLHEGKVHWQGSVQEMESAQNDVLQQFIHGSTHGPIKI